MCACGHPGPSEGAGHGTPIRRALIGRGTNPELSSVVAAPAVRNAFAGQSAGEAIPRGELEKPEHFPPLGSSCLRLQRDGADQGEECEDQEAHWSVSPRGTIATQQCLPTFPNRRASILRRFPAGLEQQSVRWR